ncbi:MAG: hypothetical protein ACPL1G_08610, partial [Thermodesulfovibrionales bacterium]
FYKTVVLQSIHKIDNLIDKLIVFSSKSEYNLNKEDVNSIINESTDYILKNIPSSHKFLKQNINKTVFVNADRKMLMKAIYYLVLSAVERTPEGAFITLGAKMEDSSPFVEISVNFNGKEFTDKEKEELFRPILDMDKLGKELNIPITQKIIEGHGGSLSIKSEKGSNSFVIKLTVIGVSNTLSNIGVDN